MDKRRALILGATSSLAVSLCRELAKDGWDLLLAARDAEELAILATDLQLRYGVNATTLLMDFSAKKFSIKKFIQQAGEYDAVFLLVGDMGNNDPDDIENIRHVTEVNYLLPAQLLTLIATDMEKKQAGDIVIVSSVAGDRGRKSNYPYGSAKAALTAFSSGLRHRLYTSHVQVMTVKPGFVDTPMTYGLKSPLIADRDYVARSILHAMQKKKDVIYVPFFWQYIMLIIRLLPETLFKKTNL